jgi:hypothetical protein
MSDELVWHGYAEGRRYVHLLLTPFETLCGMKFDGEGQAVHHASDVFELARKEAPFREIDERMVTCPHCIDIIRVCRAVEFDDGESD